jgi:hypothetical protein
MRHYYLGSLASVILLVGGLREGTLRAQGAESPAIGTWKVLYLEPTEEITLWLLKIETRDGKPQATILAAGLPNFKESKLDSVRLDDRSVQVAISVPRGPSFVVTGYLPAGEKNPAKLFGSLAVNTRRAMMQMERTDVKEIDPAKAVVPSAAKEAFEKAENLEKDKDREAALKEIAQKFAPHPAAFIANRRLLALAVSGAAAEEELRARGEQALKIAALYGPEIELQAARELTQQLLGGEKSVAVALEYARRAEKMLKETDPPSQQIEVLKLLARVAAKAGKPVDKDLEARLARLEVALDDEFIKTNIPFAPPAFTGRKGKSERVVLLELFTGAQCPPCVAADVAFDALLKSFKPSEVILLQYHLHIPGPDPLTNREAEKRADFYEVDSTPQILLNGKGAGSVGGFRVHSKDRYEMLRKSLEEQLEGETQARLKLSATRQGDRIEVKAEVSEAKRTGEDVRLRFVVIEENVRYPGGNGQRFHHHVVRGLPGGLDGFALKENAASQNVTVTIPDLRKTLSDYLAEYAKDQGFLDEERPLELKHLKIVALIQDNKTKEVLQAAQVDVPVGGGGR